MFIPSTSALALMLFFCSAILSSQALQTLVIRTVKADEEDHTGRNETYHSSERNLRFLSEIIKVGEMKSYCVLGAGMWMRELTLPGGTEVIVSLLGVYSKDHVQTCMSSQNGTEYLQLASIRRSGHADLRVSAISLYTERDYSFFNGSEVYFYGTQLSLPDVITVKSMAFTGNESWTLFPEQEFKGVSVCYKADERYGLEEPTRHDSVDVTVGSVRRGCSMSPQGQVIPPKLIELKMDPMSETYAEDSMRFSEQRYSANKNSKLSWMEDEDNEESISPTDVFDTWLYMSSRGGQNLSTNGIELRLTEAIEINEYYWFGERNWTVFQNTDLEGDGCCLGDVFCKVPLTVGSIRRGCKNDPPPEGTTTVDPDETTPFSGAPSSKAEFTAWIFFITLFKVSRSLF